MSSRSRRKRKPPKPATSATIPAAPSKPSTPTASMSWKDHPVIVAGGAAVAGFAFAMGIYTQIVLPNQTAKLDNKLEALQRTLTSQTKALTDKSDKLTEAERKLAVAERNTSDLRSQLLESRLANLFTPGNPYPNGIRAVHVGMPLSAVEATYGAKALEYEEDLEYVSVDIHDSPFSHATFYYDSATPEKKITQVLFFLEWNKYPEDFLDRALVSAFGKPTAVAKNKNMAWSINKQANLFHEPNERTFLVTGKDFIPVEFYEEVTEPKKTTNK